MVPETRYTKSDGVNIAYQAIGSGPIDLVVVPGWVSNVEIFWEEPTVSRFLLRLSQFSRLILFDKRGTGLSDRVANIPILEHRMDDLRAVLKAVGSHRAALLGYSEGGPMCCLFAATYPEQVQALVTIGSYARRIKAPDYPSGMDETGQRELIASLSERWGGPLDIDLRCPSLAKDPRFRQWWARFLRQSASPTSVAALMQANLEIDIRHILPSIRVPTLIMHAKGDHIVDFEAGKFLAQGIRGARFVELDSEDHLPWGADTEIIVSNVQEFLTGSRVSADIDTVVGTILFSDIVDSTRLALEYGDQRWTDILGAHHAAIRAELAAFRGREINTTGDGMVAMFDGPARALRCAYAIRQAVGKLGLAVRVGVHTGECEVRNGEVTGVALHIAARVAALAPPSQVLASRTVKDLAAGSGIAFHDFGSHTLKGIPEAWQLFTVEPSAA